VLWLAFTSNVFSLTISNGAPDVLGSTGSHWKITAARGNVEQLVLFGKKNLRGRRLEVFLIVTFNFVQEFP
jgi:hypothetical protein